MKIVLIAAHDPDLVIGAEGRLPWYYPEDLKHFKARTVGHTVLMGRGVFEELNGKLLPKRRNVVISRRPLPEVERYESPESALSALAGLEKLYVIGGGQIYRAFLPLADRLEITLIHKRYSGTVFFPEYRDRIGTDWRESFRQESGELLFVDYERAG